MLLADDGTFVGPSPWLIAWTLLLVAMLACGGVTAAKGRWGWVAIGLLTGGIVWCFTAFLAPAPDSLWARRSLRRSA